MAAFPALSALTALLPGSSAEICVYLRLVFFSVPILGGGGSIRGAFRGGERFAVHSAAWFCCLQSLAPPSNFSSKFVWGLCLFV
jgi:hypothetical protein